MTSNIIKMIIAPAMPPIIAILEEEVGGLGVCDDDRILVLVIDGVLDIDGRTVTNVDEETERSNVDKEIIVLDEVS